jgi:anaerobic selenocysteine-containing dehydrogenase
MLDSLCRAMGARLNFGDADSAFREIKRLHGWNFDEDLEKLSHGRGVRFQSVQKTPEQTWTAEREFEKQMAVTMGSNTSGEPGGEDVSQNESYPYVLVSGTAGVSRWVWARGISGHKSIPGDVFVEVSEVDADGLGLAEDSVVDVESPRGSIRARVVTTRNMMRGVVFVPHGFAGASANLLGGTGGFPVRVRLKKTRV